MGLSVYEVSVHACVCQCMKCLCMHGFVSKSVSACMGLSVSQSVHALCRHCSCRMCFKCQCMQMFISLCKYLCMHVFVSVCKCQSMHVCMCLSVYTCFCACVDQYMQLSVTHACGAGLGNSRFVTSAF